MTVDEAIDLLVIAKADIEWNYPLDYQEALDIAIAALRKIAKQAQYPCRNCVYFNECGDNMRTEPCAGRMTKKERK